jgi:hypothetical protein
VRDALSRGNYLDRMKDGQDEQRDRSDGEERRKDAANLLVMNHE